MVVKEESSTYFDTDEVESKLSCNSSSQHGLTSAWGTIQQHTTLLSYGTLAEQTRVLWREGRGARDRGGRGEGGVGL